MLRLSQLLSVLVLALPAAEGGVLSDAWFGSTIDGKRVGYMHELRETVQLGEELLLRTTMESELSFTRMQTEVTVRSRVIYLEKKNGEAVRLESSMTLAKDEMRTRLERQGDVFLVTNQTLGKSTVTEIPYSSDILFPAAIERTLVETALKPGGRVALRTFAPELSRPTGIVIESRDWEDVEVAGGATRKLLRTETSQDLLPGVTLIEWRNQAGEVERSELPMIGLRIVSLRTTREQSLLAPESVELLVSTFVDAGIILPKPRGIKRAVYRLTLKDKSEIASFDLPEDGRQKVTGRGPGSALLEVHHGNWDKLPERRPDARYLAPSSVLQSDDPAVVALAAKIEQGSPPEMARAINRLVHSSIQKKSLSVGLATAAEVARDLTGDCTEHAVLAAALARARGIPARVAMGIVYLDGVFGYHMWTEVFADGWHAIDPAFGQDEPDATHIKLAESALDHGFVDGALVGLTRMIANLEVEVIEYETAGKVHRGRVSLSGFVHGATYENPGYGLRLTAPKGWRLISGESEDGSRGQPFLRLEGPGGVTGEMVATPVAYDFSLARWLRDRYPDRGIVQQARVDVAKRRASRFIIEQNGLKEGLVAFLDRDTLFTLRMRPLGARASTALDELLASIDIKD